jgi:hypothetical protein
VSLVLMNPESGSGAELSADGMYRYRLWRTVSGRGPFAEKRCAFVMLNPSTADSVDDDPTIRRCRGFAVREHCYRFDVVNLFAFRATKPVAMIKAADPIGPLNDERIRHVLDQVDFAIAGWGRFGDLFPDRCRAVTELLQASGKPVFALGYTSGGQPRHPLMLAGDAALEPFPRGNVVPIQRGSELLGRAP